MTGALRAALADALAAENEARWLTSMGVTRLSVVDIDGDALWLHVETPWGPIRAAGPSVREAVLSALRMVLQHATESARKTADPDLRAAYQARAERVRVLLVGTP